MKIEQGKYYRTRDGRRVGPVEGNGLGTKWPWWVPQVGVSYADNGTHWSDGSESKNDLIAEWTDEPDTSKTWGEMTDAEKGELLLARHEGKMIERHYFDGWRTVHSLWHDAIAYRIKPEPKRETVEKFGCCDGTGHWTFGSGPAGHGDTHRITFDTLDGTPDLSSIRMEKIND